MCMCELHAKVVCMAGVSSVHACIRICRGSHANP